jgi:hypothetical protein
MAFSMSAMPSAVSPESALARPSGASARSENSAIAAPFEIALPLVNHAIAASASPRSRWTCPIV